MPKPPLFKNENEKGGQHPRNEYCEFLNSQPRKESPPTPSEPYYPKSLGELGIANPNAYQDDPQENAKAVNAKPVSGPVQASVAQTKDAPVPFHGQPHRPVRKILRETIQHRRILELLLAGHTEEEVAKIECVTTFTVENVRAQDWAQAFLAQRLSTVSRTIMMEKLKAAVPEAIKTLVAAVKGDLDNIRAADQIKAATEILERTFPQVKMTLNANVDINQLSDQEIIDLMQQKSQ